MVEDDRLCGILHSVLGAISAAPPNQWAVSALRYNRSPLS